MGVCLFVSNPFKKESRHKLNVNDFKMKTVADFKKEIKDSVGIKANRQELIYNGDCLEEESRTLLSYGIEDEATIFVYEKYNDEEEKEKAEEITVTLNELEDILKKSRNRLYKQPVRRMVRNNSIMKKLKDNIVSSRMDSVTSALIQDPELLLTVIDSSKAEDLIGRYPALCVLLKMIMSNVTIDPSANIFQDEEEDDISGIDPAILAQAELFALNEEDVQQEQQQQQQEQQQTSSQDSQHQISASELANALSIASMSPDERATDTTEDFDAALEQMRTMGITNEELSRRALRMSQGDVEVALNLIFEGTLA